MKVEFNIDYEGGKIDFSLFTNLKNKLDRVFWLTAVTTMVAGGAYLSMI